MKEIIYIQAGSFANYIGSHFWNTQESYFTFGEEESIVDHDISFREGETLKGQSTFCPRLLLFDRKANFGAVSHGLYGDDTEEAEGVGQWNGDIVEYRQEPIPQSSYHERLEEEEASMDIEPPAHLAGATPAEDLRVRFWSDYDRVFYHPRSLHRLPDVPNYENADGDWTTGQAIFREYNENHDVLEESFRPFAEECDQLQGMQITADNESFGGFTSALLTALRDEYPKLPSITFSASSSSNADDDIGLRKIMNDALCLQSLRDLSTTTVPIENPSSWSPGAWLGSLRIDLQSYYHTSALLSSHIETATLPVRLKYRQDSIIELNSLLSLQTNLRFSHLSGILPLPESFDFSKGVQNKIYDFSAPSQISNYQNVFSRVDVSRGFSSLHSTSYESWLEKQRWPAHSVHAPAIPLPSSFPSLFTSPTRPTSCSAFSSLFTTSHTSTLFQWYASHVDNCIKRHSDVIQRMGLEVDEIKVLRDELWALEDEFRGDGGEDSVGDVGMDEEEE